MAEDPDQRTISGEGLEVLRGLAADKRLSESERTMLALAIAELEHRREPPGGPDAHR